MKLHDLFNGVAASTAIPDIEVTGLTCDTRTIKPGNVFFCINGSNSDGHDYAEAALKAGATIIACQRDLNLTNQLILENTHQAFSLCCGNFYGNPQNSMTLVGVTGTNGKTTVSTLIKDILRGAGYKVGLIGTVVADVNGMHYPSKYTTPDPHTFFGLLAQMRDVGCTHAVMEVSSHGLDQFRVEGCRFAVSVFTNLTQDHLDYHKTMEEYFKAKRRLFLQSDMAVISIDDEYGIRLTKELSCAIKTFSIKSDEADYTAKSIALATDMSKFAFVGNGMIARVKFPVPGEFSVSNAMAALSCCIQLGVSLDTACELLAESKGVPGRFEVLKTNTPYTIIRDYAHTSDAILKVLTALKAVTKGRIVILFGCAGSRDRTKRRFMTQAAAGLADYVILTSDNPRHEDPMQIIEDALPGFEKSKTPYKIIPDRYEAITWALKNSRPGDTLLLAGKGHEDYQVLDKQTVHFDETEVVAELLACEPQLEE